MCQSYKLNGLSLQTMHKKVSSERVKCSYINIIQYIFKFNTLKTDGIYFSWPALAIINALDS